MKVHRFFCGLLLVIVACGSDSPETVEELASAVADSVCDRCFSGDAECKDEMRSDIIRNARERIPNGYTAEKGAACLEKIEDVSCNRMPLNCEKNLAIRECDDFLDGQTNGVDEDCNADGTRREVSE